MATGFRIFEVGGAGWSSMAGDVDPKPTESPTERWLAFHNRGKSS